MSNLHNTKMIKNTKGFTLVEIIVVLIILAILAAIIIPSVNVWIEKGKKSAAATNAAAAYQAAETIAMEKYGMDEGYVDENGIWHYGIFSEQTGKYASNTAVFSSKNGTVAGNINSAKEMALLAAISEDYVCWVHFKTGGTGIIDAVMYSQDGFVAYYKVGGSWQIVKDPDNRITQTSSYVFFCDTVKILFE